MKGDPEVIELLNEALCAELTGINQYFIHAMMCDNWRYGDWPSTPGRSPSRR